MAPLVRLLVMLVALAGPAAAAPRPYILETTGSRVAFFWQFGPDTFEGRMSVAAADLSLDFDDVSHSQVNVAVDVSHAEAGFPFATQAMRGPRVLDAAAHPTITFVSHQVTLVGDGQARIEGDITIRGVTRPITLDATLALAQGDDLSDLSHLTVRLRGRVLRSEFGATGWLDQVGDEIRLDVLAAIRAAG